MTIGGGVSLVYDRRERLECRRHLASRRDDLCMSALGEQCDGGEREQVPWMPRREEAEQNGEPGLAGCDERIGLNSVPRQRRGQQERVAAEVHEGERKQRDQIRGE